VVGNHNVGSVETIHLVREHECSFRVGIVRNDEALRRDSVCLLVRVLMVGHDQFQKLGSFAAWSRTHVEDRMMRLHIE